MITTEGMAKLADMGLARLAADEEAAQAEAGRAFGTPYYISPEQVRGEVNIDFRADIYGLGATLYHLVTGRVPFDGPTPAAVMHKHLKEPLVPPDHVQPALSVGLPPFLTKTPGMMSGLMLSQFNDSVARGNLLRQNGSTAIDFYNCHRSRIERNVIRDNLGMHANGITMYVGCTDIVVQFNECYNANGVTTNEGNNILIRSNIFDGAGSETVMGLWASGGPLSSGILRTRGSPETLVKGILAERKLGIRIVSSS
jgi:serine/threonine protein kinase